MSTKSVLATDRTRTVPDQLTPGGYQQISDLSGVVGLDHTKAGLNSMAVIQAEAHDIRWRDDGTDPTSTVGMLLPAGSDMVYTGDLSAVKFIQAASGAILNISFYNG